jgi:FkbH-like protein
MTRVEIKALLAAGNPEFWDRLSTLTREATEFDQLFQLSTLRRKAHARNVPHLPGAKEQKKFRLALIGGYSFYPLRELLEHIAEMEGAPYELWVGDFDNYIAEIVDDTSALYAFAPQAVLLMPSETRCKYPGKLTDSRDLQQAEAKGVVDSLIDLARKVHEKTQAEVIMTNFMLPARYDLGAFRSRSLGSDWSFRQRVNLELGLNAPTYLHICDLAFLAHRLGGLRAQDDRAWFESKQPCSAALLPDLAREVVQLTTALRRAPKKVLALDLDNTLWGGVVADDGIEGIEIGDTSPRGEAFKAFQKYIASLKERGVLLGVVSKNDHAKAAEVFEKHPEMVLRMDDFVSFKANWEPKSENLRQMAVDLNLGLDSIVFVDDNPAEIEIVRQFAPEVETILLGPDPSTYVARLQDCRFFEPRNITVEDAERTRQYHSESQRQALAATVTDMDAYLASLEMIGEISNFNTLDVPRLSQLINKSNQFNLTTRRRSEADLLALMKDPASTGFSFRLADKFGDHGLISIVILKQVEKVLEIDTWLMSCRVLKRQVEDEVLNEVVRRAQARGSAIVEGLYLPTAKNEMVRDFYRRMGFALTHEDTGGRKFELSVAGYQPLPSKIKITRRAHDPS